MTSSRSEARALIPDKTILPEGPHRDFVILLGFLDQSAGYKSYRDLSKLIRNNDDLPATVSPNTIRGILKGKTPGSWPAVQALATTLLELGSATPEKVERELNLINQKWGAAARGKAAPSPDPEPTMVHKISSLADLKRPPFHESELEITSVFLFQLCHDPYPIPSGVRLLVETRGPDPGGRVILFENDSPLEVGRHPASYVYLTHNSVSQRHAVLTFDPDTDSWLIRDNGSLNKVYVNRRPLDESESAILRCGDAIQIGAHRLIFVDSSGWSALSTEAREKILGLS